MNHQLLLSKKGEDIQKIQAAYPNALYMLDGDRYCLQGKKYWAWELTSLPADQQKEALIGGHSEEFFVMAFELEPLLEKLLAMQACEEIRITACLYPGADKQDILTYELEEPMDPDETGYVWDVPGVD